MSARTEAAPPPSWFECFGGGSIVEIGGTDNRSDHPRLARGAFGDVSVAIYRRQQAARSRVPPPPPATIHGTDAGRDSPITNDDANRIVVLKTLFKSTVAAIPPPPPGGDDDDDDDDDDYVSHHTNKQRGRRRQLSREVFDEICSLRLLNPHPNIVTLLGIFPLRPTQADAATTTTDLAFAFEYCPIDLHASLEWRRVSFRPNLPVGVVRTISHDLFAGLQHCHSRGVIHRDIKPGNILITSSGVIQLCDFGIARPFVKNRLPSANAAAAAVADRALCTLYYRPPEVLLGAGATDPSVDVYGAGTVVAELLTGGRPLFRGRNDLDQLTKIFELLGTPTHETWPGAEDLPDYGKLPFADVAPQPIENFVPRVAESAHLAGFLQSLIALDPQKRITAEDALRHDWFTSNGGRTSSRAELMEELVPEEFEEPVFLSSSSPSDAAADEKNDDDDDRDNMISDACLDLWKQQALKLAATRRNFLSNLIASWKNL